jgi:5-methylcytosine-specific restriction endonuclease McrA
VKAYEAKYRAAHREEGKARDAKYRAAYPEKWRAVRHKQHVIRRRRLVHNNAAAIAAGRTLQTVAESAVMEKSEQNCSYCGRPRGRERFHRDHIVSVKLGGTDEAINKCMACKECNGSGRKGEKSLLEFWRAECKRLGNPNYMFYSELVRSQLASEIDAAITYDSEFFGYQENLPGRPPIALYNVTKVDSPLFKSTVSDKTLAANGLSFSAPPETL